jgi:hypothetical protein
MRIEQTTVFPLRRVAFFSVGTAIAGAMTMFLAVQGCEQADSKQQSDNTSINQTLTDGTSQSTNDTSSAAVTPVNIPFTECTCHSTWTNIVFRSNSDWDSYWSPQYGADIPPLPDVDFSKEMLISIFVYVAPSSGYSVSVTSVILQGGEIVVTYKVETPAEGDSTLAVICIVADAIKTARYDLPVRFVESD